jgi:hypothetical protein
VRSQAPPVSSTSSGGGLDAVPTRALMGAHSKPPQLEENLQFNSEKPATYSPCTSRSYPHPTPPKAPAPNNNQTLDSLGHGARGNSTAVLLRQAGGDCVEVVTDRPNLALMAAFSSAVFKKLVTKSAPNVTGNWCIQLVTSFQLSESSN